MDNENLYFLIELTARRVRHYGQSVLRGMGVDMTIEQWLVMKTVSENEGISQLRIGELLVRDKPTISRMVKSLESKGYLQKGISDADSRAHVISLTSRGKQFVKDLQPAIDRIRGKGLNNLNDLEANMLKLVLRKIRNNLEE